MTLATPSDVTVGQLARECQVSHLAGRVIRHVFDPVSDHGFQAKEAQQLERTLKAFLPLLVEDQAKFSKYCCSIGICSRSVRATPGSQHILDGSTNCPIVHCSRFTTLAHWAIKQKILPHHRRLTQWSHCPPTWLYYLRTSSVTPILWNWRRSLH